MKISTNFIYFYDINNGKSIVSETKLSVKSAQKQLNTISSGSYTLSKQLG